MKPLLFYCYDAYCGWCYGFSPVISRIAEEYKEKIDIEVLSGGMILPQKPVHIRAIAPYIQQAYKVVEERSGIKFGPDFLWHIFNYNESDWYPDSLKPAIALAIFKELFPEKQVQFAAGLQYALNFEGRDLTDNEAYRHLLDEYEIQAESFYQKLGDPQYEEKARQEFRFTGQLKVTGFPTVFIQGGGGRFYLVSRGYTDYETLKLSVDKVIHSITTASS